MLNIVSFSGGKDSTALLLMMLERGMRVDDIVCVDMGKEFPQMYESTGSRLKRTPAGSSRYLPLKNPMTIGCSTMLKPRARTRVSVVMAGLQVVFGGALS